MKRTAIFGDARMKLHFEPDLDFQLQAIAAVCDLFRGQEVCSTEFTVSSHPAQCQARLALAEDHLGTGNRLSLSDDAILHNLHAVQLRNGLPPSAALDSGDFTVEMETGTGKTYVYLRTVLELHKRYGFTKFVIVVPSVAIKEGVYKSLQLTEEHFRALYAGTPFEYFLYDSAKLGQVRNFATSPHVQIMVVTVGAINKKDVNNLYKDSEKTGGEKPIDLIRATRPILIVDEPQSVDGGLRGRGKESLAAMAPLRTLRYSATHVDTYHMVYRLDAVDAYERKLVKQIEVASATVEDAHNAPHVRVLSTSSRRGVISAKVELDVETKGGVRRKAVTVQDGDDLESVTKRAVYRACRIGEIRVEPGNEFVELRVPGDERFLRKGEAWGDVEPLTVQREMIRRTIREHCDKEQRLRPKGIKVLSLFFIDAVERCRGADADGNPVKGDYARIFEEEYRRLARHPDYRTHFADVDQDGAVDRAHDGYFSIDKQGGWTDTAENTQINRDNAERAYTLIMKDKEKLLSLETPLRFIFSHSALREGWDNPNVFQICTLRDMRSERERRQTIGRGLRLCVNQQGERVRGFDVNTLTVVATESYEAFAANLQQEIEAETGIRFGVVEPHQFAAIPVAGDDGRPTTLGFAASQAVWTYLQARDWIDAKGRIQNALRQALKNDAFTLPDEFAGQHAEIAKLLHKLAGRLDVKDADRRRTVRPRQAVLHSPAFKALWDRIKHKTAYRVAFDNEKLLAECTRALRDAPAIPRPRLQWRKARHCDRAVRCGRDRDGWRGAGGAGRNRPRTARRADGASGPDAAHAAQHCVDSVWERAPGRLQAQPTAVHRTCRGDDEPMQTPGPGGRYQIPAVGGRAVLCAGTVRDGGTDRVSEEHARREEVGVRAGHLRFRHRGRLRGSTREERRGQGVRQAAGLVHGADAARQLQPGLGGPDRVGRRRAAVLRRRNQGEPRCRRPARHRIGQDRVRQGALRRPPRRRVSRPLRSDDQPRHPPRGDWCGLTGKELG